MPHTVLFSLIFALSALFAQAEQSGVTTSDGVKKIVIQSQDDKQAQQDETQEDNKTDKTPSKAE